MNYHIERLNDDNSRKWEEFNNKSGEGSFFHTLKWKEILEQLESVNPQYFLLFNKSDLMGIVPCIEHNIPFFKGYIPIPHTDFNNCIFHEENPFILKFLLEKFKERKCSFGAFNTLNQDIFNIPLFPKFSFSDFGNLVIDLNIFPPDRIWENLWPKKRQIIRRFEKQGFTIKEITSLDELKLFYKFYAQNIEHLSGTLQPYSHFTLLWNKLFPDDMRITLMLKNESVAGGTLIFKHVPQKTVYYNYLALNRGLEGAHSQTYFLIWDIINWAWNNGFRKISLGRQPYADVLNPRYRIKTDFGANFIPMYSKIFSLSKVFTIGYRCNRSIKNIQHYLKPRI